jgi:hypothetical protein
MQKIMLIKPKRYSINKSAIFIILTIVTLFIGTFSLSNATETPQFRNILTQKSTFPNMLPENIKAQFDRDVTWDVRLNLSKLGGITDFVYFGEAPDANDGPPADAYDTIKPPAPIKNYIYAWFNDSLPAPYNLLERDYRQYPSDSKTWNLSVLWVPTGGTPPATITITWDRTLLNMSEYDQISLLNQSGVQVSNMKITNSFTFTCPANTPQLFTINCDMDTKPPQIINHSPENGETGDTFSFNATVIDDITSPHNLIVKVNWSHGSFIGNETMSLLNGNIFTKSITLDNYSIDNLTYHFYAVDNAKTPNINYTAQLSASITDDESPSIFNTSSSLEVGTGDSITIWTKATDNIGVINVSTFIDEIEYLMIWNNLSNQWEYLYTAPSESLENHSYFITASDAAGNTGIDGPHDISVFDDDPPYFTYLIAIPSMQLINGTVNLTTTVTDNINVSSVALRINGPAGYPPMNITLQGNGTVYFFNQTYLIAGIYNYSFWGNDTSNNSDTSSEQQFTIFEELLITNLSHDWNFITLPFNQTINTTNLNIKFNGDTYNWSEALSEGLILPSIFAWDRNAQGYILTNLLIPGYGYWMYAYQECELWATGLCSMLTTNYVTSLVNHWNVFGIPINQLINKTTLLFLFDGITYNWTEATTTQNPTGAPLVLKDIFGWHRQQPQGYFLADVLEPGISY